MRKLIPIFAIVSLLLTTGIVMAADTVNVTMNVPAGYVGITTNGIDTSTLHPGVVGETNSLSATGGFSGTYKVSEGPYGALYSSVNLNSYSGGADFVMTDTQDFNILSGNHNYNVIGGFHAHASGNDNQVAMNLKSVGSMYVWSESTNPYWSPALQGSLIEKEAWTTKNGVLKSDVYIGVSTTGLASISNGNIWGWGNGETGSSGDYGGGVRTVSATGNGNYTQTGYGATSLTFNGFNFGAGSALLIGSFTGGMSGTYSMSAS